MNEGRVSPQNFGVPKSEKPEDPKKNLLAQAKTRPSWLEPKFYKPLLLELATLVAAFWAGWQCFLLREKGGGLEMLLIAFGALAATSALHVLLTRRFTRSFVVVILEAVAFLAPFYRETLSLLAAAGAVYIAFALLGRVAARGELQNSLEVRFFRTTRLSTTKLATGLILVGLLLYIPMWRNESVFLPKAFFRNIYGWTSSALRVAYPSVDANSTFIALTRGLARLELEKNAEFQALPTSKEKEDVIARVSDELAQTMKDRLEITAEPDELAADVAHKIASGSLLRAKETLGDWFMLIWSIVAFFFFRTLAVAFYWVALVAGFVLYEILLATGFIRIIGVEKTQELHEF